jgi:hypothetical protein
MCGEDSHIFLFIGFFKVRVKLRIFYTPLPLSRGEFDFGGSQQVAKVIKLVRDRLLKSQRVLYFFASPKKVTKKSSLMIFFCKISPFSPTRWLALSLKTATSCFLNALSYHPDRLSPRFACSKALWVAPSASAKKTDYFTTKKII